MFFIFFTVLETGFNPAMFSFTIKLNDFQNVSKEKPNTYSYLNSRQARYNGELCTWFDKLDFYFFPL